MTWDAIEDNANGCCCGSHWSDEDIHVADLLAQDPIGDPLEPLFHVQCHLVKEIGVGALGGHCRTMLQAPWHRVFESTLERSNRLLSHLFEGLLPVILVVGHNKGGVGNLLTYLAGNRSRRDGGIFFNAAHRPFPARTVGAGTSPASFGPRKRR